MNIAKQLPAPLDSFVLDVPANQYYDFELPPGSTYPLKGVTYPVDYGHINGHTTEDGHELDLFVGTTEAGQCGVILVDRGPDAPNEHKFYTAVTQEETDKILAELQPVLVSHQTLDGIDKLLTAIDGYKD